MIHDPWLDDDAPPVGCVAMLLTALAGVVLFSVVALVLGGRVW